MAWHEALSDSCSVNECSIFNVIMRLWQLPEIRHNYVIRQLHSTDNFLKSYHLVCLQSEVYIDLMAMVPMRHNQSSFKNGVLGHKRPDNCTSCSLNIVLGHATTLLISSLTDYTTNPSTLIHLSTDDEFENFYLHSSPVSNSD